jgi:CheY-like chemotaxis protein
LPPGPEPPSLASELHRLRSKLALLKGEVELAELDGLPPGPALKQALEDTLVALAAVEDWALGYGGQVWVLDDDLRLADLTARQLRRLGFDAQVADGDIVHFVEGMDEQAVLLIDLGETDGLDAVVLEMLRRLRPIVMTGATDAKASDRAAAIGAAAFLVKPIQLDEAAEAIRSRQAETRS